MNFISDAGAEEPMKQPSEPKQKRKYTKRQTKEPKPPENPKRSYRKSCDYWRGYRQAVLDMGHKGSGSGVAE